MAGGVSQASVSHAPRKFFGTDGVRGVAGEFLTAELATALRQETVLARMRDIGLEPLTGGPDEFRALLATERAVWVPLIQSLGITLD